MPTYKVTDPNTGKTVKLTGDSAPTEQELEEIFSQLGSSQPAQTQPQPQPVVQNKGMGGYWSEDLPAAGKAIAEGYNKRNERIFNTPTVLGDQLQKATGTTGTLGSLVNAVAGAPERLIRLGSGVVGMGADVVGQVPVLAYKSVNRMSGGNIGKTVEPAARSLGELVSKPAQKVGNWYNNLQEADKANYGAVADLSNLLGVNAGAKVAPQAIKYIEQSTAKGGVVATKNAIKEVAKPLLNEKGSVELPDFDETVKAIEDFEAGKSDNPIMSYKQVQAQIGKGPQLNRLEKFAGIDEGEAQVLSIPKNQHSAPFTDYATQAKLAMRRVDESGNPVETPMDLVGKRGAQAYKQIVAKRRDIGKQKGEYLEKIQDAVVDSGDFINIDNLKKSWNDNLNKVLGLYIDEDGAVKATASGARNEALIPEVRKMSEMIEAQPNELTPEQLDSFSANLNGFLTKRKAGQLGYKADQIDLIVADMKNVIDTELETKAKTLLSQNDFDNYKNARKNYGKLVRIEEEVSKSLGREVVPESGVPSRGAAIMKRVVQSNADAGSKALFKVVKDLTGIDLIQESHYADIAMRAANDPRMNNLLESVGMLRDIKAMNMGGAAGKAAKMAANLARGDKLKRLVEYYNKMQNGKNRR